MKIFKNQWTNIIIAVIILMLIIPGTRKPIQIFVNKIFAYSPGITAEEERETLADYQWVLEKTNRERLEFPELKGEVVLVNFWATWCPPCIAEMPSLQLLYEDYKDKMNFVFVSGEDHGTVRGFMNRKNYTLPSYRPLSEPPKPMDGKTLPTTYLIDREGNIVIKKIGAADWNSESVRSAIDKLL